VTIISKKVCMLGEFSVGKTSLVRRFVYERFDDKYISTVGVKVSRKTIGVARDDEMVDLTMMLWDLAGSEEFDRLRASYLRGSAGAILVCDLSRPDTLPQLTLYMEHLTELGLHIPLVLAANKVDLFHATQVPEVAVAELAEGLNAPYFLTSAKEGDAVEALFRELARLLLSG
jgi:small GTP-binding protein